jgi:hypothetical protein
MCNNHFVVHFLQTIPSWGTYNRSRQKTTEIGKLRLCTRLQKYIDKISIFAKNAKIFSFLNFEIYSN